MILPEEELISQQALKAASAMVVAARTAPKTRGRNIISSKVLTGESIIAISRKMHEIGERTEQAFFCRDAGNVENSLAVVLIAAKIAVTGLAYCGLCGYQSCEEKQEKPEVPCIFNTIDLGIALGSAVATAADMRFDNRIMYTLGMAAKEMKIFDEEYTIIIGVPLSASSKNIFFDRVH